MKHIPDSWDPHSKLEYLKVVIRAVISVLVGKPRRYLREEIADIEDELNSMRLLYSG